MLGVLPSFEDNCPMVILEAAAAGLPFAASAIGGIPDLISHGKTGLLFNPKQPESIRSSVESLIADNGLAEQLARSARAHAVNQFSAESVVRRHIKVYHAVIVNPFAEGANRNPSLRQ
jgi:glycosyltransferase involved in cell wall biosynthesis